MHCNFKHNQDLFITLTFKNKKNIDEKKALKELSNFLRRLKYFRDKNKMEDLKYLWCMGKDKKDGLHFHLLVNKVGFDDVKQIWNKSKEAGRITISSLEYDNTTGLGETARYFIENALKVDKLNTNDETEIEIFQRKLYKKWSASQNLDKPIIPKGYPKIIKSLKLTETPKEYKQYKTMNYTNVYTDYGMYQHIELIKLSKLRM